MRPSALALGSALDPASSTRLLATPKDAGNSARRPRPERPVSLPRMSCVDARVSTSRRTVPLRATWPHAFRAWSGTVIAVVLALVLAGTAAAGPEGSRGTASSPVLVWSTSRMAEQGPNHWVQRFTLWIGGIDGSRPRVLGEGLGPRLSPDGRWVAFRRRTNVYVVASTGGRPWLVARDALPRRWSPSSRHLAVVEHGRALYVVDVETRGRVLIDRGGTIGGASFSPSANEIVWARGPAGRAVSEGGDLFRARVDGSKRARLTRGGTSVAPVWGRRGIALARVRPSGDAPFPIHELWMMRPRGGGLRRVTRANHYPIAWSSDGRRLLTVSYRRSSGTISVVDVAAARIHSVVRGKVGVRPRALSRRALGARLGSERPAARQPRTGALGRDANDPLEARGRACRLELLSEAAPGAAR